MDASNNDNERPQGADEGMSLYAQAEQARAAGNQRLAFHLYIAAFEQMASSGDTAGNRPERALRTAWDLAISLGDRRLAETAFEKLVPYLRPDEAASKAKDLAGLAMGDLSALGIDSSNLPNIPGLAELLDNLPPEVADLINADELPFLNGNNSFNVKLDDEGPIKTEADVVGAGEANSGDADARKDQGAMQKGGSGNPTVNGIPMFNPGQGDFATQARNILASMLGGADGIQLNNVSPQGGKQESAPPPKFSDVPGFTDIKHSLRSLGIGVNPDSDLGRQAADDLCYHGIDGNVPLPSVIIRLSKETDLSQLVHAAAGEMGVPFGQISIRAVEGCKGRNRPPEVSIRVRGDFGPTRHGEIPTSGVLLIDNADLWPDGLASGNRRLGDFIGSLACQPDVAVILTASEGGGIPLDLLDRLGSDIETISALPPRVAERYEAWSQVASRHPSAKNIDVALLAMVSNGMMPDAFEKAVHDAATDAWRLGMREGRRHELTTIDVLGRLADYAESDEMRERIWSVIDNQWSSQLDHLTQGDLDLLNSEGTESGKD